MNEELVQKLETLGTFLKEMTAINSNPYSAGLNTDQLLKDLSAYVEDLKAAAKPEEKEEKQN